ncbi:FecR domain-containing protein [Pleomorphovibrio marinus]|uniref:FecR domain-containing protein n=1 Tax=Pleomorphovibrio marinus TaxID=2164132 RepID=UPI000E0B11B7|nr:FecR domain-containing protein [Pleomorphovibrio marinus]
MKEDKLIRFLNGQASEEERMEVYEWLQHPEAEREVQRIFKTRWEANSEKELYETKAQELLKNIHMRAFRPNKKQSWFFSPLAQWSRVAATFLLVGFCLFYLREGIRYQKPEVAEPSQTFRTIERTASAGEKLKITLPDRSRVIVNSLSTISFPSNFGKFSRELVLDGEAFFEVEENMDLPFTVTSGTVTTVALGTSFNILNRGEEVKVALTHGKVLVSDNGIKLELIPGEMASWIDTDGRGLVKSRFSEEEVTLWKEGKISFSGKSVEDIFERLSLWYGVSFNFEGRLDFQRKLTGRFSNESLEDVLTGLGYTLDFEFKIIDKEVTIKPQMPMDQ